jgi:hypothetical protein
MRKKFEQQFKIGITPIQEVKLPERSRDELPPVLKALQYIYSTPDLNRQVYSILERNILANKQKTGRYGMTLWELFVLAVVRLCLDTNYDRLHLLANYDKLLRSILGVETTFGEAKQYSLQSIKDNIGLLDEQTINQINTVVIKAGHSIKKKEEALRVKVDTYVLETNVHFPTDINLLWDSCRKCLDVIDLLSALCGVSSWRKAKYWRRRLKKYYRSCTRACFGPGRKNIGENHRLVQEYLRLARELDRKVSLTKEVVFQNHYLIEDIEIFAAICLLDSYQEYLKKFADQIERRILKGERIPSEEKIYSIFEPHTEWLQKGKAGNKVELGHNILIATDQNHFIIHHKVIEHTADAHLTVPTTEELLWNYGEEKIQSISFDKNFYSKPNKDLISLFIENVVLPKKGKLNQDEKREESTKEFKLLKNQHCAVESNINQLEYNGLNKCPDKGIKHFKRYVSLGVLSYNLHRLGKLIIEEEKQQAKDKNSGKQAKIAA